MYVIVTIPEATPVTIPDEVPTVANEVLLLVHTPPVITSERVIVSPASTDPGPVMGASVQVTVAEWVAGVPLIVKVIVAVPGVCELVYVAV